MFLSNPRQCGTLYIMHSKIYYFYICNIFMYSTFYVGIMIHVVDRNKTRMMFGTKDFGYFYIDV